jgi:rhodanese-related sulfurtransferase
MGSRSLKTGSPIAARKYFETRLLFTAGPVDLKNALEQGEEPEIIDVRPAEDYAKGHIPGAINIPEERWRSYSRRGLSKKRPNIFYAHTPASHLASRAAAYFAGKGYPVMELEGGMEAWQACGYEVEVTPTIRELPEVEAA